MIKQFAIFKNTKKENEKQPDYTLSAKLDDVYVQIGAGWIKEGKSGKFIAVKMSDEFNGKAGFSISMDKSIAPDFSKDTSGKVLGQTKPEIVADEIDF
jgi:hypothetical protein